VDGFVPPFMVRYLTTNGNYHFRLAHERRVADLYKTFGPGGAHAKPAFPMSSPIGGMRRFVTFPAESRE